MLKFLNSHINIFDFENTKKLVLIRNVNLDKYESYKNIT